jgi:hypothetical protein
MVRMERQLRFIPPPPPHRRCDSASSSTAPSMEARGVWTMRNRQGAGVCLTGESVGPDWCESELLGSACPAELLATGVE